jgi:hypothetical protein
VGSSYIYLYMSLFLCVFGLQAFGFLNFWVVIVLFFVIFSIVIVKKLLYCILRAWICTKNWINLSNCLEKTP